MANMKKTTQTFKINHIAPGTSVKGENGTGDSQPPRNSIRRHRAHCDYRHIFGEHEDHVGRRGIFDDEPGDKLGLRLDEVEGGRLVSASAEMKKITNIGNSGSQYQPKSPNRVSCAVTMSPRLSEPAHSSTVMMTKPIETS